MLIAESETLLLAAIDWESDLRIAIRMVVALVLGGILGWERERKDRPAGMRTHMIVALGAALFTAAALEADPDAELAQVVKGIAAGVGFLGAGTILKERQPHGEIKGLTSAANIWATAAIGLAAGAGLLVTAAIATVLAFVVLKVVSFIEPDPKDLPEAE